MRKRKPLPINQTITQTSELSKKIPEAPKLELKITNQTNSEAPMQSITSSNDGVTHITPMIKYIPFYPNPSYKPPPKPIRMPMPRSLESTDVNPEINIDFEENSTISGGYNFRNIPKTR